MIVSFLKFTAKVAAAVIIVEIVDELTGIVTKIRSVVRGFIPG